MKVATLTQPESFQDYLASQRNLVEDALSRWYSPKTERLIQAIDYSLLSASKRLRPIFCLETCLAFSGDAAAGLPAAMALEMVHSYSLIHDDLPAMDDDDLRRGRPTNHKVYGDALAILSGDALLTSAFEVLAKSGNASSDTRIEWVRELSSAAGADGMVLGQAMDMEAEAVSSIERLELLHRKKTGALLAASVVMGGIAAGVSSKLQEELRQFASDMGLAFQIRDDVLDIIGGTEIGKPLKSDEKNEKLTYVSLLGLEGAKTEGQKCYDAALKRLRSIRLPYENRLEELTKFVIERKF